MRAVEQKERNCTFSCRASKVSNQQGLGAVLPETEHLQYLPEAFPIPSVRLSVRLHLINCHSEIVLTDSALLASRCSRHLMLTRPRNKWRMCFSSVIAIYMTLSWHHGTLHSTLYLLCQ